ncbi:MAG TPA: lyase family protein, partial [Dehalococcoidia bacterium]|nr:lyase family protein [Dehalococcoidia bacterium]
MTNEMRTERDSMGEVEVPVEAYYGASTMRAVNNFQISGSPFPRVFIHALGLIKLAAARANGELGLLDADVAKAIEEAAREVADGKWDAQFVVDIFQTGSGTSTNTNANEVIAARASEILTGDKTSHRVHPNDHVNMCQSSNDVIPATIRIAAILLIIEHLWPALVEMRTVLDEKSKAFWGVIKTGRTHLQDATPIRLGQEFKGYGAQIERGLKRLNASIDEMRELPLGGTAVGTGINAHREFGLKVAAQLHDLTGGPFIETDEHFQAQSNIDALVSASGSLRTLAVSLTKIADDIRWLGSGPRAGLG